MSKAIENKRIEYLDFLKGFAILWIVWWHTCHPSFVDPYYHVPLFFVISGLFFKPYPFKDFIRKKTETLLIPFVFFYIISYLYRIVVHLWDFKTIKGFPWMNILDVFKCMPNGDYLWVNVPLWFLLCLFNVCILYYFIHKLPSWIIYLYIIGVLLFSESINQISTPFFLNDALKWTAYYALGSIGGGKLISSLQEKKNGLVILCVCILVYIILRLIHQMPLPTTIESPYTNLLTIVFIIGIISLFSFIYKFKFLSFFKYYGLNSLIVLGLHAPILIIYQRIIYCLFGHINYWGGFAVFIATTLTMLIIIPIVTKLFPKFVGIKPTIK